MADDSILTEKDKALFRQSVGEIKPLKAKRKVNSSSPQKQLLPSRPKPQESPPPQPLPYLSDYYKEEVSGTSFLSYNTNQIPKKRFLDLKNGKIRWEAKLDLHGLKPEEAKDYLISFILKAYQNGQRSLLIIHGKGGRHGGIPILKNLVNYWLPQLPEVLVFCSALPRDGGNGALYLLLKRLKI